MTYTTRFAALVLALATTSGCVSYAKKGDQAAATGNWRVAVDMYGRALKDDPGSGELQEKFARARTEAIRVALATATRCKGERNNTCIDDETTYVLSLDPGSKEAATLRSEARTGLAVEALERATAAVGRAEYPAAARELTRVRELTGDAAVQERATTIARDMTPAAIAYVRTVMAEEPSGAFDARLTRYEEVIAVLTHVLAFAPEDAGLMATARSRRDDAAAALAQQRDREEAQRKQAEARDLANRNRTVALLSVTIGAGKQDGSGWDGLGGAAVQALNSDIVKSLTKVDARLELARMVAGPTMQALSKPDVGGVAELLTPETQFNNARNLEVIQDSFTPAWTGIEWQGVDVRSARLRITLEDADMTSNDVVGTVEISSAELMRAADAGNAHVVIVANAANTQVLMATISVR